MRPVRKLSAPQLRKLIREAAAGTARSRVQTSGEVESAILSLVTELLTIAGGPEVDDEMHGQMCSQILMQACVECVEMIEGAESPDSEPQLPPPHPRGSMKGAW